MYYYQRLIDDDLAEWAAEASPKPLVLRGARQTGKTASVRELGRSFELLVEVNLERYEDQRLVAACASHEELLQALAVRHNVVAFPARTLLFIDEIQADARVVGWLRFLREDHPALHVVAAGSLMEVRLQERGFSFPVGRVTFRYLHPFSYVEFLMATGRQRLATALQVAAETLEPPGGPILLQAEASFREYSVVGGMPEAVGGWAEHRSAVAVRQVHADLIQAFAEDLQRYRGVRDLAHVEAAFHNLHHHFGQRFKYENFAPGFRSLQMKTALQRLEGAMICRRVWPTSDMRSPLRVKPRAAPKLLPLDVGVACSMAGVAIGSIAATDSMLDGRAMECVVGQLLLSADRRANADMFFWVRQDSRSNSEVDFLLKVPPHLLPVEVKAGAAGSLKSLHQFLWRSGVTVGLRLHGGTWADESHEVVMPDGRMRFRLLSLPQYMAELLSILPINA